MTTITGGVQFGGGVLFSPPTLPMVIQSGLILNLQTAPTSGGTWTDTTGSHNTTIVNPTVGNVSYVAEYGGGVRILVKNSSYFDTGISAATTGNTFTISMTTRFDLSTTYWATWWGNDYYSGTQGYLGYQTSSTAVTFGSPSGAITTSTFTVQSANIANVNVWDFTISGTTANYFVNGVWKGTGTIVAPSSGVGTANLYFGARHQNTGGSFTDTMVGTYYSMRVYNRALSNVEISTNYTTVKSIHGLP